MIAAVGVLLGLLKVICILLAIVLALALFLVLCILFVPIRYQLEGSHIPSGNDGLEDYRAEARVSWLLHMLSVSVQYGTGGLSYRLRIFGIDILKLLRLLSERRNRKKERSRQTSAMEDSTNIQEASAGTSNTKQRFESSQEKRVPEAEMLQEGQTLESDASQGRRASESGTLKDEQVSESVALKNEQILESEVPKDTQMSEAIEPSEAQAPDSEVSREKNTTGSLRTFFRKRKKKTGKKRESIGVSWNRWKEGLIKKWEQQKAKLQKATSDVKAFRTEIRRESNRRAVGALWRELCRLLGKYKPRSLRMDVRYSLGDPALTGELLGGVSMFPLFYRYPCTIIPDFQTEQIYADGVVQIKGKVTVCHVVFGALRLWWNKDVKQLVRRISKK